MKKLTNKGQAFSTFQLLIAAVVALALLGVLLPMISGGFGGFGNSPSEAASQKVSSQINAPGNLSYTDAVKFKTDDTLDAFSVAEDAQLGRDQVYVLLPQKYENYFTPQAGNESASKVIRYDMSSQNDFKIGVLCDYADNFEGNDAITEYYPDVFTSGGLDLTVPDNDLDGDIKLCLMFPERASN